MRVKEYYIYMQMFLCVLCLLSNHKCVFISDSGNERWQESWPQRFFKRRQPSGNKNESGALVAVDVDVVVKWMIHIPCEVNTHSLPCHTKEAWYPHSERHYLQQESSCVYAHCFMAWYPHSERHYLQQESSCVHALCFMVWDLLQGEISWSFEWMLL